MKGSRRRAAVQISHDRWLVSYADFVTLLFAFFVVLYASAQIDRNKAVRLSSAIESAFQELGAFQSQGSSGGGAQTNVKMTGNDSASAAAASNLSRISVPASGVQDVERKPENLEEIRAQLEKALAAEIKRNDVALRMGPEGLVVSLREVGFFDSGSATIKPGAEGAVGRVAVILQEHACAVRIEGHTDNVPIHTSQFASNWELSTARATDLVKSLIEAHGISANRLAAAGYAEFHPVAGNDSEKGRQLNRRVDLVILRETVSPPPVAVPINPSPKNSLRPPQPRAESGTSTDTIALSRKAG
jgi:chemotaxis protein MotB